MEKNRVPEETKQPYLNTSYELSERPSKEVSEFGVESQGGRELEDFSKEELELILKFTGPQKSKENYDSHSNQAHSLSPSRCEDSSATVLLGPKDLRGTR